jgi:hypothetical protein
MTVTRTLARSRHDIRASGCFKCGGNHFCRDKATGWVCGGKPKDSGVTASVQERKNLHERPLSQLDTVLKQFQDQRGVSSSSMGLEQKLDFLVGLLSQLLERLGSNVPFVLTADKPAPPVVLPSSTTGLLDHPAPAPSKNPPAVPAEIKSGPAAPSFPSAGAKSASAIPRVNNRHLLQRVTRSAARAIVGRPQQPAETKRDLGAEAPAPPQGDAKRHFAAARPLVKFPPVQPSASEQEEDPPEQEDHYTRAYRLLLLQQRQAEVEPAPPVIPDVREEDYKLRKLRPKNYFNDEETDSSEGLPRDHRAISSARYQAAVYRREAAIRRQSGNPELLAQADLADKIAADLLATLPIEYR